MRLVAAMVVAAWLGGCATFSKDGGFGDVQQSVMQRTGKRTAWSRSDADAEAVRAQVLELLSRPLGPDDAAQIALLNNPGLQAAYAELGISEADLVQAGRMTNPHFAYLRTRHGDESKLEWALTFPIVDLLTMPLRTKMESRRFEEVKSAVAGLAVGVSLDARRAWYEAVASDQLARYMAQVKASAEASVELARRMASVGNFPRLTLMREQAFYAEVTAQLARSRQNAVTDRERLARLMGLFGGDLAFKLPDQLPDLPAALPELGDIESLAIRQRFDVQAAKRRTEALAESLGLSRATRFVNALELGPASTREGAEPWKRGFEISLELPIFDWGTARVAKAESIYMQSVRQVAETAVNARSEVRETYFAYRTAYDTARHYRDEIVPLRKKISDEILLRYNGMLASVFELLADAREQVTSVSASIEAQRDYWVAQDALQAALNGAPGVSRLAAERGGRRMVPNPALAGH